MMKETSMMRRIQKMMKMVRMKMKMRVELGPLGCFPSFFEKYIVTVKIVF